MRPEQDGQLSGEPVLSLAMRFSACAGLYVAGRGLRIRPLLNNKSAPDNSGAGPPDQITFYFSKTNQGSSLSLSSFVAVGLALAGASACGPHAHIPPVPVEIPKALEPA